MGRASAPAGCARGDEAGLGCPYAQDTVGVCLCENRLPGPRFRHRPQTRVRWPRPPAWRVDVHLPLGSWHSPTSSTFAERRGTRTAWDRRSPTRSTSARLSAVRSTRQSAPCWIWPSGRGSRPPRWSETSPLPTREFHRWAVCWRAGLREAWADLQPGDQRRPGSRAGCVRGVVWGLWHAPVILLNGYEYPGTGGGV